MVTMRIRSLLSRMSVAAVVAVAISLVTGCDLDRRSPNAPTEEDVLATREGVLFLATGLQARFGDGEDDFIYTGGLITDELGATTLALPSYKDTEEGRLVSTYDAVVAPWETHYRTIRQAEEVLAATRALAADPIVLDSATKNGVISLALLFKAMSLGELLQLYQQILLTAAEERTPFVSRATALTTVIALLDSAAIQFRTLTPGATFNNSVRARGFDLRNTIFAMLARYHRLAGNDAAALAAADSVDLSVVSSIPYTFPQTRNPINNLSTGANYVKPRDQFRLAVDSGDLVDKRDEFFITVAAPAGNLRPLDEFRQYANRSAPIPLYYPGEVSLIRAEALLNLGRLPEAATVVNAVRTKCNTVSLLDPEACSTPLPASALDTPGELRAEIYRQRRVELFATGLRWEDVRRLGQVGRGLSAQRCWLLYPDSERQTNPDVPADPESSDAEPGPRGCGV